MIQKYRHGKIYFSLDRIEYLAMMGKIVMHIHLNKRQMAELAKKKVSQEVDGQQEVFDDALNMSLNRMQSNVLQLLKMIQKGGQIHLTLLSLWLTILDLLMMKAMNLKIGLLAKFIMEEKHMIIMKNQSTWGKKCMSCKGKFNTRSKYQICKICDKLIHVNNKKKCMKMKDFRKN